jgi:hypothetical protein
MLWHCLIASASDVKPETTAYTSEELMKVTEEQLAASAVAAWNAQQPPSSEQQGLWFCIVYWTSCASVLHKM